VLGLGKEEVHLFVTGVFDLFVVSTCASFLWFFGVNMMRQFDQMYEVFDVGQEDKAAFSALNHDTFNVAYSCGCNG
jgi:predicted MFS family arabinose efflux permease